MIVVDGVCKRFGAHQAVDGVSLRISQGEIFGLIGPNGAGKSTLFKLIAQLIRPDAGTITVNGHREPLEIKRQLGYLPEEHRLYEHLNTLHYLEHFCLLLGLPRARAAEVLTRVGLEYKASERISKLSKGMRQKVAFARTLLADPPVLLLDEPTYGLDPQTSQEMRGWIVREARNKVVVLSSHNLHEAERVCHRVAIIHRGRVAACDSPRALIRDLKQAHLLEVSFRGPKAPLEAALAGLPLLDPPGWDEASVLLSFSSSFEPFALLRQVLAVLSGLSDQLVITGIVPREPTLEDVFLKVTGERFEAADEPRRSGEGLEPELTS